MESERNPWFWALRQEVRPQALDELWFVLFYTSFIHHSSAFKPFRFGVSWSIYEEKGVLKFLGNFILYFRFLWDSFCCWIFHSPVFLPEEIFLVLRKRFFGYLNFFNFEGIFVVYRFSFLPNIIFGWTITCPWSIMNLVADSVFSPYLIGTIGLFAKSCGFKSNSVDL